MTQLRHVLPTYGTATPTRDSFSMASMEKLSRVTATTAQATNPAPFRHTADTELTHRADCYDIPSPDQPTAPTSRQPTTVTDQQPRPTDGMCRGVLDTPPRAAHTSQHRLASIGPSDIKPLELSALRSAAPERG
jgi:hypothetical protein